MFGKSALNYQSSLEYIANCFSYYGYSPAVQRLNLPYLSNPMKLRNKLDVSDT